MRKELIIFSSIVVAMSLSACGKELASDEIESKIEMSENQTVEEESVDKVSIVENLIQGVWEYYEEEEGWNAWKEKITFSNGRFYYCSYYVRDSDNKSESEGVYEISDSKIVSTFDNGYVSYMDYNLNEDMDKMTLSWIPDSGATKGEVRKYSQTEKWELDVATLAENRSSTINHEVDAANIEADNIEKDSAIADSNVATGEQNALRRAKDYLKIMPLSYIALKDQLEYDGFTESEAEYAVENCDADWYEQAYKKALEYLEISAFTKTGLQEQLEFDGFTTGEAIYGVDMAY